MFTDMVGYTALGQRNELLSLALVDEQRRLIRPVLARHKGREVKTMGDAFLVEFSSALDAVRCAYEIQRVTREANFSLAEDRRLHLRIGVHLGDVVESEEDISGDAVNIASRIETLADDGGVCITRQVLDQVQNKFGLPFLSIGFKTLKGVNALLEVYRMSLPWDQTRSTQSQPLDKRRIAVLPFANVSPDPQDEYFADGMTDELISTISRISELRVIARSSAMKYKHTGKGVAEIGRELQVGSILEGTVRKAGNRLRINAQLIDPGTEEHRWAETYDRELRDVFAIQSDIASRIGSALRIELLDVERSDIEKQATSNIEAYSLYLKGRQSWSERTREGVDRAVGYFQEALRNDPEYALAYAGLADCFIIYADYNWMRPREAFPKTNEYARKAIEINPRLAEPHASLGAMYGNYEGLWSAAEEEFKRAIDLKPSYALAHMWYALVLLAMLRFEDGYKLLDQASQLDPLSLLVPLNRGAFLTYMGRPREATEILKRIVDDAPSLSSAHMTLGFALLADSRNEEAIEEVQKGLEVSGGDPAMKAEYATALGLAGRREDAKNVLRELLDHTKVQWVSSIKIAQILFTVGRTDEAFDYLDKSIEEKSTFLAHGGVLTDLRVLPWYHQTREDPRWDAFLRRAGVADTPAASRAR